MGHLRLWVRRLGNVNHKTRRCVQLHLTVGWCLIPFVKAINRKGLKVKYTIKHHASNNKWYIVTKNPALTYSTVTWFDTKSDAQQYVKNETDRRAEMMSNIVSISDYFKVAN